jgi:hypothetical protein
MGEGNLDATANKTLELLTHSISVDLIGAKHEIFEKSSVVSRKRTVPARNANNAEISSSPFTQSARNSFLPSNAAGSPRIVEPSELCFE